jgi:hypothetical protein
MSFKREHQQETIIYLALWVLLFLAPVMSLFIRTANTNMTFDWNEVLMVWKEYIPFFAVFLIHNHLLAPILIYRQKRWLYLGSCLVIMAIFQVYQCNHRPHFDRMGPPPPEMRLNGERPPLPPDLREGEFRDRNFREGDFREGDVREGDFHEPKPSRGPKPDGKRPPIILGQHDIIALVILILMLGMNLGIKLYFKQRGDHKKMDELEKQNLAQQLEYLKYQINPHFFMNTLNNIHALVDIAPEKAKATILELSKMMRFMLYEGNKPVVPLDREIAFLQNYITLMKLRYTEKVNIQTDIPEKLPNKEVPPLLFITFVENAFKHGVSYQQESFIDMKIEIKDDSALCFTCRNSRIPKEDDKHGGVGLANVKQRLELIYGESYTLDIQDEQDSYTVNLTIPL